jgi:hypothetical protein
LISKANFGNPRFAQHHRLSASIGRFSLISVELQRARATWKNTVSLCYDKLGGARHRKSEFPFPSSRLAKPVDKRLDHGAAQMIGRIDWIKPVARECEVKHLDEIARGKGIGNHDVTQDRNAVSGEDSIDRVRLLAEAKRNVSQIVRPRISRRRYFAPSRPSRGTLILGEPVEMDERQSHEIAGAPDRHAPD